ncbi:hypothetical protein J1N35_036069 [Gossypium stocksii]|uniref:Uncharacterized protein n=1 Tax=Gossypium stocksii TaxID=47602 RepID=A0A9D3UVV7_9ROSI|nr:hypothetical protein J1N35_036069 [Gossypium stocksii]
MTISRARQEADTITGLICLGRTHRSTTPLPAHIHRIIALHSYPDVWTAAWHSSRLKCIGAIRVA